MHIYILLFISVSACFSNPICSTNSNFISYNSPKDVIEPFKLEKKTRRKASISFANKKLFIFAAIVIATIAMGYYGCYFYNMGMEVSEYMTPAKLVKHFKKENSGKSMLINVKNLKNKDGIAHGEAQYDNMDQAINTLIQSKAINANDLFLVNIDSNPSHRSGTYSQYKINIFENRDNGVAGNVLNRK